MLVVATNQDLRQLVAIGRFRKDLYYRLNVLHIDLPPLRRRREDIPLLVKEFVRSACARMSRPEPTISPGILRALSERAYPGNVRELRNLVERALVFSVEAFVLPEEELPRIGDCWRLRYHSLALHNEIYANHLPYMPFPPTMPK